jgi:autotransporter-associated beta strand protein
MLTSISARRRQALKLLFGVLTTGLALPLQSLHAADGTWTATSGGSWGDAANWTGGTIANASGDIADFAAGGAAQVITLDVTRSLKAIQFGSGASGPITFNAGASGSFRLNPSSSGAQTLFVDAASADHIVNTTIQLQAQDNQTWQINGARTFTLNGALTGNSATRGFTKSGSGTLTLNGTNTFSGALTISGGTVVFNYASSNGDKISSSGSLVLQGGALSVVGNASAASSGTFTQFTLGTGSSSILVSSGAAQSATLALGGVNSRIVAGGVLDIELIGASTLATTSSNKTNLIGGGNTTVGQNNWATVVNGTIRAYSGYTVTTDPSSWNSAQNVSIGSNFSGTVASGSINTLRFGLSEASSVNIDASSTLKVNTGGILVSSGVGANNLLITGGTLASGNSLDLIIHQHNTSGSLTIDSVIPGSGVGLTKTGAGVLVLGGANTYTGANYIYAGTVRANTSSALGTGSVNLTAATLDLAAGVTGATLTLNNGAVLKASGAGSYTQSSGTQPIAASGASVAFSAPSASDSLSLNSALRGGSGSTLTVSGSGTVTLGSGASASDAFAGLWVVDMGASGILKLSDANALGGNGTTPGTVKLVGGTVVANSTGTIPNAMTLAGGSLAATNQTGSFGGAMTLQSMTTSTVSLVDPSNGTTARNLNLTGAIGGFGHLNITGSGIATFTADNSYSGNTTIAGGRLTLVPVNGSSSNNIPISPKISIGSAGTLDVSAIPAAGGFKLGTTQTLAGTGNVDGDVTADVSTATVMPGDTDSPGNLTLRSNFTLSSGKLAIESDSSSFSVLTVSGAVTLGGTLQLKAAHQPGLNTPITILNKTGVGAISGIFSGLADNAYFHPDSGITGDWYKITYFGGTGNDIVISRQAIPEPGSLALLAVATSCLLRRRRREAVRG